MCDDAHPLAELAIPLPHFSDSDGENSSDSRAGRDELESAQGRAAQVERVLRALAAGDCTAASVCALDIHWWRSLAAEEGLHVAEDRCNAPADALGTPLCTDEERELGRSLEQRGYCKSRPLLPATALRATQRMLARLKRMGIAPAFIYVFDEAWTVLEACWRGIAPVLAPDEPVENVVLEPSFSAHLLSHPEELAAAEAAEEAQGGSAHIARFSYPGGNFGLPHRDHSSRECFDGGRATLVSIWCPLTRVEADNGCMHIVPREFDELLHRPDHPLHLLPFDQHSRRCNFAIASAVALAPCEAGSVLAWFGSAVHWGGACSRYSQAEPRASLTGSLRIRGSKSTELQRLQQLPEVRMSALTARCIHALELRL